jgi:hypothetical protein
MSRNWNANASSGGRKFLESRTGFSSSGTRCSRHPGRVFPPYLGTILQPYRGGILPPWEEELFRRRESAKRVVVKRIILKRVRWPKPQTIKGTTKAVRGRPRSPQRRMN